MSEDKTALRAYKTGSRGERVLGVVVFGKQMSPAGSEEALDIWGPEKRQSRLLSAPHLPAREV